MLLQIILLPAYLQMSNQVVANLEMCVTEEAQDRILSFLVKHPRIPLSPNSRYLREWTPRYHYGITFHLTTPGTRSGWVQCMCCRAGNISPVYRRQPYMLVASEYKDDACEECIQAWLLSRVSKSWRASLKNLVAAWNQELGPGVHCPVPLVLANHST